MKKCNICLLSFVCGLILFLLFTGIGVYRFGGVTQLFASINGESVVFSPKVLNLGHCAPNSEVLAVFKMSNLSSKAISVVGGRTSYDCAMPEGLPLFILSGQTVDITVKVRLPQYDSLYNQTVIFMVAESHKLGMYPVRITAAIPNPLPRPIEESGPTNITVEPQENIDTDE